MSSNTLHDDRRWFDRHPDDMVRFRRQCFGELTDLHARGDHAPVFRQSFSGQESLS